jgi:hypothetical protein
MLSGYATNQRTSMITRRRFLQTMLTVLAASAPHPMGAVRTATAGPREGEWRRHPIPRYPHGIGSTRSGTKHTRWAYHPPSGTWYVNGGDYAQPGEEPPVGQSGSNNTFRVDLRTGKWLRVHGYWPEKGDIVPSHPDETVFTYDTQRDLFWHGGGFQWPPYAPGGSREDSPIPAELQDRLIRGHWMSFDPKTHRWRDHGPLPERRIRGKFGHYDEGLDQVLIPYFDGGRGNVLARYDCAGEDWLPLHALGGPGMYHLGNDYQGFDTKRRRILALNSEDFSAYYLDLETLGWKELKTGRRPPLRRTNTYGLTYHAGLDAYAFHGGRDPQQRRFHSDLWLLSAEGGDWVELQMRGEVPAGRAAQVLLYDPGFDALVSFGGVHGPAPEHYYVASIEDSRRAG